MERGFSHEEITMTARYDSPPPEWYEPPDIIEDEDQAPTPINRPTIQLTESGYRLLALLRVREVLPTSSTTVAGVLDRRIDDLLGDVDVTD